MRYTPVAVEEVFEWMDAFSQVSGVLPSISAKLYAELTMCPSVALMLSQVSQKDIFLGHLQETDPAQYNREIRAQISGTDEHLEESDPYAYEKRIDHYFSVFRHHGFDRKLIEKILEHMSPSSNDRPRIFNPGKLDVSDFFNPEPYEASGADDEDDDEAFEQFGHESMAEQMRITIQDHELLKKSVDPTGWIELMRKLNFNIIPESIQRDHEMGIPSFFITDQEGELFPVFIVAAVRAAYEKDSSASKTMKEIIQHQLAMNNVERALLFYGAPSVIADDKDMSEGLVYWGEVFWDSRWGEMILHQKTNSFDKIARDAAVISKGLGNFKKGFYRDKGLALMNFWVEHHNFTV